MEETLVVKKSFFIQTSKEDIKEHYDLGNKLGDGSYGVVYIATHKTTGQIRAVKSIPKSRIRNPARLDTEIAIMTEADHPNIIKFYEVYENARSIYLVMDYCSGGELFNYIIEKKRLTEKEAAGIFNQILSAIRYLHSHDIVHRDMKPENLIFASAPQSESPLKLIDFGLSKIFVAESAPMTTRAGTPFYIAPEILTGRGYGKACDIWSCGVILYILLCGYPPFFARTEAGILEKVRVGNFTYDRPEWANVTEQAKDLINNLLKVNIGERFTIEQALSHPWIALHDELPDTPLNFNADSLKEFRDEFKLKKAVLMCIATQCSDSDISDLRNAFVRLDSNGDGTITLAELEQGLRSIENLNGDIESILKGMDVDKSGSIDYSEFLAATIDRSIYLQEERLRAAFETFDRDKSGKISAFELREILGKEGNADQNSYESLIIEADKNQDGEVDFNEFLEIMSSRRLNNLIK